MKDDEAERKAKKVVLEFILLGIGPFFMITIIFGMLLTKAFIRPPLFNEATAMLTRTILGLVAVIFWGAVAANEYRKIK